MSTIYNNTRLLPQAATRPTELLANTPTPPSSGRFNRCCTRSTACENNMSTYTTLPLAPRSLALPINRPARANIIGPPSSLRLFEPLPEKYTPAHPFQSLVDDHIRITYSGMLVAINTAMLMQPRPVRVWDGRIDLVALGLVVEDGDNG